MIYSPEYSNAARAGEMSAREVQRAANLLKREFHFQAVPAGDTLPPGEWTGIILGARGDLGAAGRIVDITGTRCGGSVLSLRSIRGKCHHGCVLWHSSLERYGAGQLNDRFRAAGITIDDQAWLGWFAVKLLWEAGTRGVDPATMSYDGHKGVALHFNSAGILVQPYYMLRNDGGLMGEAVSTEVQESATCDS